jgi:hypothetical protein
MFTMSVPKSRLPTRVEVLTGRRVPTLSAPTSLAPKTLIERLGSQGSTNTFLTSSQALGKGRWPDFSLVN